MTDEFVNVARHAVTLASGQPLAPGEQGTPDLDTDHDQGLRDAGAIIPAVEPTDYDTRTVADLTVEAEDRGLTVKGTGKDGNVVKDDLVAALEADDEKETRS